MDFYKTIAEMAKQSEAGKTSQQYVPSDEDKTESAHIMIQRGYEPLNPELFAKLAGYYSGYRLGKYTKGIGLFGANGIGKTYFLNKIIPTTLYRCKSLVDTYKDNQFLFEEQLRRDAGKYDVLPDGHINLTIDEIGEEQPLNNFGNKYEIFTEIIHIRHKIFEGFGGITHFTSNLSKAEFSSRYGSRSLSRMNQMCFLLDLDGDDLR